MNWFEKAIVLDADLGDTWGWYLKFLKQHGTEEKREDVISKCVTTEPKHGEVWQRVRKEPKNAYLSTREVLLEVMGAVGAEGSHKLITGELTGETQLVLPCEACHEAANYWL